MRAAFLVIATITLLTGCAVGPDYERPAIDSPTTYRTAANAKTGATQFEDSNWFNIYPDPLLKGYIEEALTNNWDVQIAAARVIQANAAARVARSQFVPDIGVGGDVLTTRTSEVGAANVPPGTDTQVEFGDLFVSMASYEIDLWGRIRRANEAARAQLLATKAAEQTVRQTIAAQVATAYMTLVDLDNQKLIATQTLEASNASLVLTTAREEGGVASLQDVRQSQILVSTADASLVEIERRIEQTENELSILLSRNPGSIARSSYDRNESFAPTVPPGLPSELLERRPDIRTAEQQLIAANASIGEAKAAFFPAVTLTGFFGYQTVSMSDLFTSPARAWQFGPAVSVPVFTGGSLRGNLQLAEAQFTEAVSAYQQTVQQAFAEVSNALISYERTREFRKRQEERTEAHRSAAELANIRYEGGVTSYLEVLYNEQELFNAELGLSQARLNETLSVIQLYRALGGGWVSENTAPE